MSLASSISSITAETLVVGELKRAKLPGLSDADLATMAQFVIALRQEHAELEAFRRALSEFLEAFSPDLLDALFRCAGPPAARPAAVALSAEESKWGDSFERPEGPDAMLKQRFPGLAMPNAGPVPLDMGESEPAPAPPPAAPFKQPRTIEVDGVYRASVVRLEAFGCFVEVRGEFGKRQGLVHVSNLSDMRVQSPAAVVKAGQEVFVELMSMKDNGKLDFSIKAVDQKTGVRKLIGGASASRASATGSNATPLGGGTGPGAPSAASSGSTSTTGAVALKRRYQERTAADVWEESKLVSSGVLSIEAYPSARPLEADAMFDEAEEETEVEIITDVPRFLRGADTLGSAAAAAAAQPLVLEPIKIVAKPEGTLQRAAMTQSALQKERKELRMLQAQQLIDSVPRDLNRPWQDPMAEDGERRLAAEMRGVGLLAAEAQEWRQKTVDMPFGPSSSKTLSARAVSIKEQRESLPVFRLKNELIKALRDNPILVVIGETGSGKTTQMTQYVREMGWTGGAKRYMVGCTQPRRVAAMSVAKRVAEEVGCNVGEDVGYTIRFEDATSDRTEIKYMTDGMLMREYLMDGDLKRYSCIILDEAHERTLHTDILFALLKALQKRRLDLKLIVTSATLDADKFSKYFFDCPIFSIPGRTFPVEIMYAREAEPDYVDAALITVMQIHLSEPPGDVLLFLTGQEEIDQACEVLYQRMKALGSGAPDLLVLPVYGALPAEMQSKIFDPAPPSTRKCIVATNIAEASLTIDGIFYVIDPGFAKQNVFNPKTGMDALVVTPISQASARQRAGRAGRTGPGKCFRLYTEAAYKSEMLPTSIPEIQRTNLGNVVLQLKAMGINDLLGFDFMDPPPKDSLIAAMEALFALEALDDDGLLTRMGRKMAEFPLDPSLSKTIISSVDMGCADEVLSCVAMLSIEGIWFRPKDKQVQADQRKQRFFRPEGDHITLLSVYEGWRESKFSNAWCQDNFIQSRGIRRAADIRKQLLGIMERYRMEIKSCGPEGIDSVRKAFTAGFFTQAARRDPQEGYRTMVDGQNVYIHPGSALFQKNPQMVIYHEVVLTSKEYMRNVMVIDARWLAELAPNFYKKVPSDQMSLRKRQERIEPLSERHKDQPKDMWRLSKRMG